MSAKCCIYNCRSHNCDTSTGNSK